MQIDGRLSNGKAKAAPIGSAADHGEENPIKKLFWNTGTIVDNVNATDDFMVHLANGEVALDSSNQFDRWTFLLTVLQRLYGIADHIQ